MCISNSSKVLLICFIAGSEQLIFPRATPVCHNLKCTRVAAFEPGVQESQWWGCGQEKSQQVIKIAKG